jgi:hypothetical protein
MAVPTVTDSLLVSSAVTYIQEKNSLLVSSAVTYIQEKK